MTKFQSNPTVDKTVATIRKFSSSIETLKMLLQCEMNFSLLKQLLRDSNGQIELTQSIGGRRKLLGKLFIFTLFSFSFLSLFLLTVVSLLEKILKVNIGLGLHE